MEILSLSLSLSLSVSLSLSLSPPQPPIVAGQRAKVGERNGEKICKNIKERGERRRIKKLLHELGDLERQAKDEEVAFSLSLPLAPCVLSYTLLH